MGNLNIKSNKLAITASIVAPSLPGRDPEQEQPPVKLRGMGDVEWISVSTAQSCADFFPYHGRNH